MGLSLGWLPIRPTGMRTWDTLEHFYCRTRTSYCCVGRGSYVYMYVHRDPDKGGLSTRGTHHRNVSVACVTLHRFAPHECFEVATPHRWETAKWKSNDPNQLWKSTRHDSHDVQQSLAVFGNYGFVVYKCKPTRHSLFPQLMQVFRGHVTSIHCVGQFHGYSRYIFHVLLRF